MPVDLTFGDFEGYLEIVIGINTLSIVFWEQWTSFIERRSAYYLDTQATATEIDADHANIVKAREATLSNISITGRMIGLSFSVLCLVLLFLHWLPVNSWFYFLLMGVAPLPIPLTYLVRYGFRRYWAHSDDKFILRRTKERYLNQRNS